jgi:hypothetical protein
MHGGESSQIVHAVIDNQREDGDAEYDQYKTPDHHATLAGSTSLWCLSGQGEHMAVRGPCCQVVVRLKCRPEPYSKAMPEYADAARISRLFIDRGSGRQVCHFVNILLINIKFV